MNPIVLDFIQHPLKIGRYNLNLGPHWEGGQRIWPDCWDNDHVLTVTIDVDLGDERTIKTSFSLIVQNLKALDF
jgi:hypothetical protein